jgi:hypothetical protein
MNLTRACAWIRPGDTIIESVYCAQNLEPIILFPCQCCRCPNWLDRGLVQV